MNEQRQLPRRFVLDTGLQQCKAIPKLRKKSSLPRLCPWGTRQDQPHPQRASLEKQTTRYRQARDKTGHPEGNQDRSCLRHGLVNGLSCGLHMTQSGSHSRGSGRRDGKCKNLLPRSVGRAWAPTQAAGGPRHLRRLLTPGLWAKYSCFLF